MFAFPNIVFSCVLVTVPSIVGTDDSVYPSTSLDIGGQQKLFLNPLKIEFLLLQTLHQLKKFEWLNYIQIGDTLVELVDATPNMDVS